MRKYELSDIQSNDKIASPLFKNNKLYQVVSHWDSGVIIRLDEERGWSLASRRNMSAIPKIEKEIIANGIITEEDVHKKIFWYVPLDSIERVIKNKTIKWID